MMYCDCVAVKASVCHAQTSVSHMGPGAFTLHASPTPRPLLFTAGRCHEAGECEGIPRGRDAARMHQTDSDIWPRHGFSGRAHSPLRRWPGLRERRGGASLPRASPNELFPHKLAKENGWAVVSPPRPTNGYGPGKSAEAVCTVVPEASPG
ncbi:MAG: hypothetical protein ACPIOQ_52305 [Promethearchaeia archaeon]